MKTVLICTMFLISMGSLSAQSSGLANQYFRTGEYEKAAVIYEKLYMQRNNNYFFQKYIECLIETEEYDKGIQRIDDFLKKDPSNAQVSILKGRIYELQGKEDKANQTYENLIDNLTRSFVVYNQVGSDLINIGKYDLAEKVYLKGSKALKDEAVFAYNLGQLYRIKGDIENMTKYYLLAAEEDPSRLNTIKLVLQRYVSEENLKLVQQTIYNQIAKGHNSPIYTDFLIWVALQREDYASAFIQARAEEMKNNGDGSRVYEIGKIAENAHDYDVAIQSYNCVTSIFGQESSYYLLSFIAKINTRKKLILQTDSINQENLRMIDAEYDSLIANVGKNAQSSFIMLEQAKFNLQFLDNHKKAKSLLEELISFANTNETIKSKAKLALADYYLLTGDRWESTLLYMQVDKDVPEGELGELARYKNAKLSYYMNDFVWAKEQFDVLKRATSRVICNDALDMSIFIADNLNLDTTAAPISLFASAELALFQHKYDLAFEKLDSLVILFPEHDLNDDVFYLRGNIYEQQGNIEKALQMYSIVKDRYPEEIRADNAIFRMATLYEEMGKVKEAISLYEILYTDYNSSTFSVYAREQYRKLIGDNIQ